MIFHFKPEQSEKQKALYIYQKENLKNFIRILFTDALNSLESKGGDKSLEKDTSFRSTGKNSLSKLKKIMGKFGEDEKYSLVILRDFMDAFLDEKNLYRKEGDNEKASNSQIGNLLYKLNNFNPEAGRDKEKSDSYSLRDKKIGLIYDHLEMYVKSNMPEYYEVKNKTEYLDASKNNEDSDDDYTLHDKIGTEDEYELDDYFSLIKEFYQYHLEGKDLRHQRIKIAKIYNILLLFDYSNLTRKRGKRFDFILGNRIPLTMEERFSMEKLIDFKYLKYESIKSIQENVKSFSQIIGNEGSDIFNEIYNLMANKDTEYSRVMINFFTMCVKCNISLTVKDSPYFKNVELFRVENIKDLNDFRKVMESTKITSSSYPDFPLLADYTVSYVEKLERDNQIKKTNLAKETLASSIRSESEKGSSFNIDNPSNEIPEVLRNFLNQVIKAKKDVDHPNPNETAPLDEVAYNYNGINITADDVRKAYQILGTFADTLNIKTKLLNAGNLINALKYDLGGKYIDNSDSEYVLVNYFHKILNQKYEKDGAIYYNINKVHNMWKVIKNAHDWIVDQRGNNEILTVLKDEKFTLKKKYGVRFIEFRGEDIPIIERTSTYFFVTIFHHKLKFSSEDFSTGEMLIDGVSVVVNLDSARLRIEIQMEKHANADRILEMQKNMYIEYTGVDSRTVTRSISSWANTIKPRTKKNKSDLLQVETVLLQNSSNDSIDDDLLL